MGRGLKRSKKVRVRYPIPAPLLSAPMVTVLLQFVNITIERVAVTVKAQKVYHKWE